MIAPGTYHTNTAEETFEFAYQLGEQLTTGVRFLLSGDLGAGKTVFAKGIGAGLQIDPADISSPTFTIINEYPGRLPFYHIDLYRLATSNTLAFDLGLDEIMADPSAVVVIEWAERLGDFRLDQAYEIHIAIRGETEREITINARP